MAAFEDREDDDEEEEFTFPSITNTPPRFFESPPLWRPSFSSSPSSNNNTLFNELVTDHVGKEEKMDVLWEDLNEENIKNRGLVLKSGISGGGNVKFGCLQSFRGQGGGKRPPSVALFIKVLGKWLLLRNAHRSIKKRLR